MRIAFLTSEQYPQGSSDDLLALPSLKEEGFEVDIKVWDKTPPSILSSYDAVIFRSVWNYHRKKDEFVRWVDELSRLPVSVFNSPEVVRWNLEKKYLLELASAGVPIPEMEIITNLTSLTGALGKVHGGEIVIKPEVSLNGEDTHRFNVSDRAAVSAIVTEILNRSPVIIQRFVPEILSGGELSFVFFNGMFSHALRKVPSGGEFRIHPEYGGSRIPFSPSVSQIGAAEKVLAVKNMDLLYARVDMVESKGVLLLIELEVLDPMLYLGYGAGAPERFAKALAERLRK